MDDLDLQNIDVKKFVQDTMKLDKHKWIFAGLEEKEIRGIEERTASRFEKIIPALLEFGVTMQDPQKAATITRNLEKILRQGGNT